VASLNHRLQIVRETTQHGTLLLHHITPLRDEDDVLVHKCFVILQELRRIHRRALHTLKGVKTGTFLIAGTVQETWVISRGDG
jgi:hypothetical protein